MNYLLAPDSFKGSLSALSVAHAMELGIRRADPSADVKLLPIADGGEGTVDAVLKAAGGTRIEETVVGPLGDPVRATYGILPDGRTAIIEMAAASGITLVPRSALDPLLASTYGTGQLIRSALDRGCGHIIIGIGGSATNDGGTGMASALGCKFLNAEGQELAPGGGALADLASIDASGIDPRLAGAEITVATDVENVLCGENGASHVFGPQKGATPETVVALDRALARLAEVTVRTLGIDMAAIRGGGAAGGLGAGLVAYTGAQLKSGIDLILDLCSFDKLAASADLVMTGEGNTDFQTAMGKTPVGVAKRAKAFGVPVICLSGGLGRGYRDVYRHGIDAAFSIMQRPGTLEEAFAHARDWIADTAEAAALMFRLSADGRKRPDEN